MITCSNNIIHISFIVSFGQLLLKIVTGDFAWEWSQFKTKNPTNPPTNQPTEKNPNPTKQVSKSRFFLTYCRRYRLKCGHGSGSADTRWFVYLWRCVLQGAKIHFSINVLLCVGLNKRSTGSPSARFSFTLAKLGKSGNPSNCLSTIYIFISCFVLLSKDLHTGV